MFQNPASETFWMDMGLFSQTSEWQDGECNRVVLSILWGLKARRRN